MTLYYLYDASGSIQGVIYNNTYYYFQKNLQGDVVRILNSNGTVVTEYAYDAWGNILSVTGSLASTIGQYNPFRYRGYYYDSETGYYYLQSRYYDPVVGRFLNADKYTSTGQGILGNNMFAYCGNNPVNSLDDSGELWDFFSEVCDWFETEVVEPAVEYVDDNIIDPTINAIEEALSDKAGTFAIGQTLSLTVGCFTFSAQGGFVIDTQGNVALQGTLSAGITTSGEATLETCTYVSINNAPTYYETNGGGLQVGYDASAQIPYTKMMGVAGLEGALLLDDSAGKYYEGINAKSGLSTLGRPGGSFHVTGSTTKTTNSINIFEILRSII